MAYVEEAISSIEAANSLVAIRIAMQKVVEDYGFAAYNFLDAGRDHLETPFFFGTSGDGWERTYDDHAFVEVDPAVAAVRRRNTPFIWEELGSTFAASPGPKSAVRQLMDAAFDFGWREGVVIPVHFRDRVGRPHSMSAVFYWSGGLRDFRRVVSAQRSELHLIMVYFVERCLSLVDDPRLSAYSAAQEAEDFSVSISDRERDVLAWASRGKSAGETAEILKISDQTVQTHIRNATRKLGASNKTHAVTKAIIFGLIN